MDLSFWSFFYPEQLRDGKTDRCSVPGPLRLRLTTHLRTVLRSETTSSPGFLPSGHDKNTRMSADTKKAGTPSAQFSITL